ncbi:MAG: NmrA family NAD(P)-binding protein [Nitriliruptorales bacterium]
MCRSAPSYGVPPKAAEKLGDGVELVIGDYEDPASVRRAVEGVDRLLLSSADSPRKIGHEIGVIDAAAASGVERIVKLSTVRAQAGSPLPPLDWHGRIEQHLRRSTVPAVVLRSMFYMPNLLTSAEHVRIDGALYAPADGGRIAMIDPRDVAAATTVTLTTAGHEGQTYELTGPQAITYAQVAEELSAVAGRGVQFVAVPEKVTRQGLVAAGAPEWLIEHLTRLFGLIREDALAGTTDAVNALTGHEPRTFSRFARHHAELFRA